MANSMTNFGKINISKRMPPDHVLLCLAVFRYDFFPKFSMAISQLFWLVNDLGDLYIPDALEILFYSMLGVFSFPNT